ncbi:NAD(P)H:quinone oxidoreductase [Cellulomonas bogoriensis]|uniref:NAD(P)H dehydrogenase n=1 Tax=Cellulomonas bogoriensis 69B4 = DSM 16987 TaxID=1386082 RepID=A0A0A0BYK8_9CELL|nr:NAD(P)H:quinone oxidoreductase [Cellulomonas bogoriensis]KGM13026.1 NAD(P)H dehydrogenase [Cellulomonas bogoriensis 69B4 = DSM 16987]
MSVKVAIIYHSATGNLHHMAQRLEGTAKDAGAEVRRRQVTEIAPAQAIEGNPAWKAHVEATKDEPRATPDDMDWADVVLLGSPTRYGNVSSQFQQFIDTLGPLWAQGGLADKVYSTFTSTQTAHGGQETTLHTLHHMAAHFGGIIVPPGYTDPLKFADGNPYGSSHVSGATGDAPLADALLAALDHQVRRVLHVAERLTR